MTKKAGKPVALENKKKKVGREFSAGFIVFRETDSGPRFLLLNYGKHWDYPKGHLEKGETAWEAAVRELEEETGIRKITRVGSFKHEMRYFFQSKKKGLVSKTVTFFLGRTDVKKVVLSDEHEGYDWLPYRGALGRLTFANAREMLREAWTTMKAGREMTNDE